MKIIVGLGNPGEEYAKTRHNAGFMVLEKLKKLLEFDDFKENRKLKGQITLGEFNGEKIILVKPLTFMNLSGECVRLVMDYYKVNVEDLWVVYDDIDLPIGTIRIRIKGSSGTHKGVISIVNILKDDNFARFRVGIESRGDIANENQNIESFVLESFRESEISIIESALKLISEALLEALNSDLEIVMNKFNRKST